MSKSIIFCADGTWNGPGESDYDSKTADWTNVFKLFLNLTGVDTPGTALLEKEQERTMLKPDGTCQQIAKYLHGVGDSDNFLVKVMGGTLGAGLINRIVRGYTFVSRNYVPGDKIVLIGFSRGAYTVRSLAGLIATKGLLNATKLDLSNKTAAYRRGAAVWYQYRREALQHKADTLQGLENFVVDLPGFFDQQPDDAKLLLAPIEAVGVWETVGALGIPEYNKSMVRIDAFRFADTKLSAGVKNGFQAIAIDEQRDDFSPTFWDPDPRVTQVLFAGAHADVGGGYPVAGDESGLSDWALQWMTTMLAKCGVFFATTPVCPTSPDPKGVAHQPWASPPFDALPSSLRRFVAGYGLSKSVIDRLNAGPVIANPGLAPATYKPGNLAAYVNGKAPVAGVVII